MLKMLSGVSINTDQLQRFWYSSYTVKRTCKLTPKRGDSYAATSLWCKLTLSFLLKREANIISPVKSVEYFYLLLL